MGLFPLLKPVTSGAIGRLTSYGGGTTRRMIVLVVGVKGVTASVVLLTRFL